jgi:ATP-dependent RNA helicase DHX57
LYCFSFFIFSFYTTGANPNLRVVLMSATADAQLFASYFEAGLRSPTAVLTIPGFTHPVTDLFLEDVLEATGFVVGKSSKWAKTRSNAKTPTASHAGHGVEQTQPSSWQPPDNVDTGDWSLQKNNLDGIQRSNEYSQQTVQSLCNIDESAVNHELIEALVVHVASTQHVAADDDAHAPKRTGSEHTAAASSANGAILIFAPGAEEIGRIVRTLQSSPRLAAAANPHGVRVLPLHGALPPSQQTLVFQRPQRGELKIVVSTNVAETSITIDDVTAVVDAGRVKEMRFDASRGLARLQETWVSQASAQQRRGRAGRVRPGKCWRLFSKRTWARMQQDTPPEVARAPLQALVMDIKGIMGERAADAAAVLGRMLSPPDRGAIEQAVSSLQRIGALDATSGALTPLGSHLVRMPCDPRLGKMLVFGTSFFWFFFSVCDAANAILR